MSLLNSLFGGSKNSSNNKAYDQLNRQLSPSIGAGTSGIGQLSNALSGGFDDYLDQSSFNFALGEGMRGITGAGAAKGLLRSGASTRALARYADGLKGQRFDNYLNQLGQLGQLGLGAAGVVAGAGQQSSGKSSNGILPTLFSDRRVKTDIIKLAQVRPGLNLYSFRYVGLDLPVQMGFMADEVKRMFPAAVSQAVYGPTGEMRDTVNYEMVLENLVRPNEEAA
jgi:hypothetical protein